LRFTSITAKGEAVLAAALGRTELGGLKCVFVVLSVGTVEKPSWQHSPNWGGKDADGAK
jgi:hypothetical protein